MNLEFLRIGLKTLLGALLEKLPHELQEALISRAVLAIVDVDSDEQRELEITAIAGEIKNAIQEVAK